MIKPDDIRELVRITVKDLIWINTKNSGENIDIIIGFGNTTKVIPIKIKDLIANRNSCKEFIKLISEPLEAILKGSEK